MVWAGVLALAGALAASGFVVAGATPAANAPPAKPSWSLLDLYASIDARLDRLIADARRGQLKKKQVREELEAIEGSLRSGFQHFPDVFDCPFAGLFLKLVDADRNLEDEIESIAQGLGKPYAWLGYASLWFDYAADKANDNCSSAAKSVVDGLRDLRTQTRRLDARAKAGKIEGDALIKEMKAIEQHKHALVGKEFPSVYGISYLALLKHAVAMQGEKLKASVGVEVGDDPSEWILHLVILKRHKQAIENALKAAAARPAPTIKEIETIPPFLQPALSRELEAVEYLDAAGNRLKAERSIEQAIADLLKARTRAEVLDLGGIEGYVSTAIRADSKALAEIEDDPPDVAAAKRQLQAAVTATKAGIAAVEKLLTPAAPKPTPGPSAALECGFRTLSLTTTGMGLDVTFGPCRTTTIGPPTTRCPSGCYVDLPVEQVVIRFPSAVYSAMSHWRGADYVFHDGSCTASGRVVTCGFPQVVGTQIRVGVAMRERLPKAASVSVTVTLKGGRTVTASCKPVYHRPEREELC